MSAHSLDFDYGDMQCCVAHVTQERAKDNHERI